MESGLRFANLPEEGFEIVLIEVAEAAESPAQS